MQLKNEMLMYATPTKRDIPSMVIKAVKAHFKELIGELEANIGGYQHPDSLINHNK